MLTYDVFINDPPPQDGVASERRAEALLAEASTLIYGQRGRGADRPRDDDRAGAASLGDWVASKGRNLTDIFITHGHGDHWFAAGLLAERFGARVVASRGHDRADARQRRHATAAVGQGLHGHPADARSPP